MKKILVSFIAMMAVASSAWAAETMNMHDQVNNAQAPAHQMQSSAEKSAVQGESMKMMDMSGHDQAAMSHEMMQNGNSAAHQVYRPVGYDVKDIAEVAFWLHSVQFARPDQAVQQRSPLSSMIRTEEQVVFAAQTDHPQRIFSDVIVRLSPAIICIVRQRRPLVQGVCERFRQF